MLAAALAVEVALGAATVATVAASAAVPPGPAVATGAGPATPAQSVTHTPGSPEDDGPAEGDEDPPEFEEALPEDVRETPPPPAPAPAPAPPAPTPQPGVPPPLPTDEGPPAPQTPTARHPGRARREPAVEPRPRGRPSPPPAVRSPQPDAERPQAPSGVSDTAGKVSAGEVLEQRASPQRAPRSDPPSEVSDPGAPGRAGIYAVRPGDSLWSIARQRLGSEASAVEIARFVEALWSLNADVIRTGSPELILPGQKLALPQTR